VLGGVLKLSVHQEHYSWPEGRKIWTVMV